MGNFERGLTHHPQPNRLLYDFDTCEDRYKPLGDGIKSYTMKPRILCWFSCGGPSAVAAKETIAECGQSHEVLVVNCDTRPSEHPDNYRFSREVETWLGQQIIEIRSTEYKDVDDVIEKKRYLSGIHGAPCTTELKKVPRFHFALPDDIHVFGFTADSKERKRAKRFELRNPDLILKWTLIEKGITKAGCLARLRQAGIKQPFMYDLGFDNNNCPGCVKSKGAWYWSMIRLHFPEVFKKRCEQSRKYNCRLIEIGGVRMFLDELPAGPFKKVKENLSCGPECGQIQFNLSPAT